MRIFVFETKNGWSYEMVEKNEKSAVNRFIEEVGIGVPFSMHEKK